MRLPTQFMALWVLMNNTRFGKNCYAIGGNVNAANNYGNRYEMDAIASCVVGGVLTIQVIVAGVLILGVINYGLTFIGLNSYWRQIIKGLINVSAVAVDIRKFSVKK